jgi:hypothetical protein
MSETKGRKLSRNLRIGAASAAPRHLPPEAFIRETVEEVPYIWGAATP